MLRYLRFAAGLVILGIAMLGASLQARAQDRFPAQGIELIVTFGPGGGTDVMARVLAPLLQAQLGVPVFVSNVPGHSGNAGLTRLMVNPADGYTIAVLCSKTVAGWAAGLGYARPSDFFELGLAQQSVSMLFVPADSRLTNWADFLEQAKARPGRTRIATAGAGTTDDMALRLLAQSGYDAVGVPYALPQDQHASLARARADAVYEDPGDVATFLASGQWRPLVVFDDRRHAAYPEVPAIAESGIDATDLRSERMLVVSAKTPPERRAALSDALAKALATPQWKRYCEATFSCAHGADGQPPDMERAQSLFRRLGSRVSALPPDPVATVSRR